jgi:hypothetical protein
MEVSLRKQSWHYRLNQWSLDSEPKLWSLCPYFWLTVWHLFTAVPRVILRYFLLYPMEWVIVPRGQRSWDKQPVSAFEPNTQRSNVADFLYKAENTLRKVIGYLVLGAVIAIFILSIVLMFINDDWFKVLITFGLILGLWLVLMVLFIGLAWMRSKIRETDTWNALSGMAYSIKNKICPAINWK